MALGHKDRARILGSVAILGAGIAVSAWIWHVGAPEGRTASDAPPPAQAEQFHIVPSPLAPPEAVANNLGVSYAIKGAHDRAIAHFELAISHSEDYLPGHKNLLAACVETERWDEALKAAQKAEALHPLSGELKAEYPPEAHSASSGQAPSNGGDADLSEAQKKRKALSEDKDFIANLGRAYLENGKLERARRRYGLYVRLFPQEVHGFNGLGEVAFRQEDYETALRLFSLSLRLYGDQPDVVSRLTEIQEEDEELAGKVQWVLANYLEPKDKRPGWGVEVKHADVTEKIIGLAHRLRQGDQNQAEGL